MKDLKIQFGSAQEVDFADFLNEDDLGSNKISDYFAVANGEKDCKEVFGCYMDLEEFKREAYDWLWTRAIVFASDRLKGWGGRECSAYCNEFFNRMNFKIK